MNLAKRVLTKSKIFGDFTLRSGKRSDAYFDKYRFESDPEILKDIASEGWAVGMMYGINVIFCCLVVGGGG